MNLRDLRYFEAVARNEKFIEAAKELHISQPSLSNTIKRLEKKEGYKLFERSTKKLILTEFGEIFNKHAKHLLSQYDNTIKDLEEIKHFGKGKIKIGIIESARYFIADIIKEFTRKYPEIGIQIMEMSPTSIEKALENYDIHLGVTTNIKNKHTLNFSPVLEEQLSLAVPADKAFSGYESIDIIDLREETLIHSLSGYGIRNTIVNACNNSGFEPRILYETESLEMAINLVEIGVGVSVMPNNYLKSVPTNNIKIIPFKNNIYKSSVNIVHHAERYLPNSFYDLILMMK